MTAREAKELSLEVWGYLAAHPWIGSKENLPNEIYVKIKGRRCECPLCELYQEHDRFGTTCCPGCPLITCNEISAYSRWLQGDDAVRQRAAQEIVEEIEAWEPEEKK